MLWKSFYLLWHYSQWFEKKKCLRIIGAEWQELRNIFYGSVFVERTPFSKQLIYHSNITPIITSTRTQDSFQLQKGALFLPFALLVLSVRAMSLRLGIANSTCQCFKCLLQIYQVRLHVALLIVHCFWQRYSCIFAWPVNNTIPRRYLFEVLLMFQYTRLPTAKHKLWD